MLNEKKEEIQEFEKKKLKQKLSKNENEDFERLKEDAANLEAHLNKNQREIGVI